MPGFDGTGPQGKGPLTGRGLGYCVLRKSGGHPAQIEGWAGMDGIPVASTNTEKAKEVIQMPFRNGTGPGGRGSMTGRAADLGVGFPVGGYRNPTGARGFMAPYNTPVSSHGPGYGTPYTGWLGQWFRRGLGFAGDFGFRRGFGFGRGRRGGRARFGHR